MAQVGSLTMDSPASSPLKFARPGRLQMPSALILPGPNPALDRIPPSPAPFVGSSSSIFDCATPMTPSLTTNAPRLPPFDAAKAKTPTCLSPVSTPDVEMCDRFAPPISSQMQYQPYERKSEQGDASSRLMKKYHSAGPKSLSPIATHHFADAAAPLTPPLTPPCRTLVTLPAESSKSVLKPTVPTMSSRLLADMALHPAFEAQYLIEEELGSGGFGFVVRALRVVDGRPLAVKFIDKKKIPSHGWVKTRSWGEAVGLKPLQQDNTRLIPMEAYVLRSIRHDGVVSFIDLFEDDSYFYLVMEHHGSPWNGQADKENVTSPSDLPALAAAVSAHITPLSSPVSAAPLTRQQSLSPPRPTPMLRRSSCDLFECIEVHSKFNESTARYVFAQIVDVVHALNVNGICHRDIKDENIVVSTDFKVKLIDFGSAVIFDPRQPAPFYNRFFGTTSFASAEILRGEPYQAAPAEVWSLGVLLSILMTGECPFADASNAKVGRLSTPRVRLPVLAEDLMKRCLTVDLEKRISVREMRRHPWLRSYFYTPATFNE